MGGIIGGGGKNLNGGSQHTINYGVSKDLILVHTVQLKLMIKTHFLGRMVSSGISDVAIASAHSKKKLRCLSAPDATSLHHCLKNRQLKLIYFQW